MLQQRSTRTARRLASPAVLDLLPPTTGRILPLSEVPDAAYAEGCLGPGFAIDPTDGLFRSPLSGTVRKVVRAEHAVYVDAADGVQVLVHVGLGAHALRGLGTELLVEEGQEVAAGDPLCVADLEYLRIAGLPTLSPVAVVRGAADARAHLLRDRAEDATVPAARIA